MSDFDRLKAQKDRIERDGLDRIEREVAEQIAMWLSGQGPGFSRAAADIRAGKWRQG